MPQKYQSDFEQLKTPSDLMKFMDNNIIYGFVGKSGRKYIDQDEQWQKDWFSECTVQSGDEILRTKCGTCWDQVELERKWFTDHKYEFKTIFSIFEMDKPNNYPTHTFLAFKGDNKWYWLEHSFGSYNGIHEFSSLSELVDDVNSKQLKCAIDNGIATAKDKKLIKNYTYDRPKTGLGVIEYLKHATSGKKLNV